MTDANNQSKGLRGLAMPVAASAVAAAFFVVNSGSAILFVQKSTTESVTNSTVLQSDDELYVTLGRNKRYSIEGIIFADSAVSISESRALDQGYISDNYEAERTIKIGFTAPEGAALGIGYLAAGGNTGVLRNSGEESVSFRWGHTQPLPVYIQGTVTMGSTDGEVRLNWAQGRENSASTHVLDGSYLKFEEVKERPGRGNRE